MLKIKNYLFEGLLFAFSVVLPFALGVKETFGGMLASFFIFYILKYLNYWVFFVVFIAFLITSVILLPTSIWYGYPNATMIGAFLETDFQEAKEFIQSLPFYAYLLSLVLLVFGGIILYLGKKKKISYNKKSDLVVLAMAVISLVITIERPLRKMNKLEGFQLLHSHTLLISYYPSLYNDYQIYAQLRDNIKINIKNDPSWEITSVSPKYQNYVLVIGESVRRDYMSLYGFPQENSSFLKEVKGTIIEGYTSAGPNTTSSLLRTLVKMKGDNFIYENNLITLAKKAGFETFWLSNQGMIGEFDTPLLKIASLAKYTKFLKKGDYDSKLVYDSALIPIFKEYLSIPSSQPRLFILHLIGSHPAFDKRLEQPIHYNYYNENLSAYVQTIEQTDSLLKNIYQTLQEQNKPFSLIYFSDHGLVTKDRGSTKASLGHGYSKGGYRVPFVLINSDDTEHKTMKVAKSGYHFLEGIAKWLGIRENSLDPNYNFLSTTPDSLKVLTNEYIFFDSLSEDEIIK